MTLFDWLATPAAIDLTHAVTLLIVAVAGWITYRNRQGIRKVDEKLDHHIKSVSGDTNNGC